MKDLDPAPVRMMQRRSAWLAVRVLMIWGNWVRRGLLRAFSLAGREIVRWAIVPLVRRVRAVRTEAGVEGIVVIC
jgi:hypothetical protein